jgi:cytidine deaminase
MKKKSLNIHYHCFESLNELNPSDRELVEKASLAMTRAYAPYSEFQVGAALRMDDNSIIEGNNQENAAYPSGLCAERVALFYAGARFPEIKVKTIAVIAHSLHPHSFEDVASPCGACRQVMLESQSRHKGEMRIILASVKGKGIIFDKVEDILPFSFDLMTLLTNSET